MDQSFVDAQSLRMLKAFSKIRDLDARETLILLAEAVQSGAPVIGKVAGSALQKFGTAK